MICFYTRHSSTKAWKLSLRLLLMGAGWSIAQGRWRWCHCLDLGPRTCTRYGTPRAASNIQLGDPATVIKGRDIAIQIWFVYFRMCADDALLPNYSDFQSNFLINHAFNYETHNRCFIYFAVFCITYHRSSQVFRGSDWRIVEFHTLFVYCFEFLHASSPNCLSYPVSCLHNNHDLNTRSIISGTLSITLHRTSCYSSSFSVSIT